MNQTWQPPPGTRQLSFVAQSDDAGHARQGPYDYTGDIRHAGALLVFEHYHEQSPLEFVQDRIADEEKYRLEPDPFYHRSVSWKTYDEVLELTDKIRDGHTSADQYAGEMMSAMMDTIAPWVDFQSANGGLLQLTPRACVGVGDDDADADADENLDTMLKSKYKRTRLWTTNEETSSSTD